MDGEDNATRSITSGADTHKDLHVAAVVDDCDLVLETRSFPTTRQGYRQMLAWMRSFGEAREIVEVQHVSRLPGLRSTINLTMP